MLRFLVVDDDPVQRATMRAILARATAPPPEIKEAANAHDAYDLFEKFRPHVVFLDMELTGGPGGLYTTNLMKGRGSDVRVVLVTGLPTTHPNVKAALARGASAHLAKPARLADIQRVLADLKL